MKTVRAKALPEHCSADGSMEEPPRLRPYILTLVSSLLQKHCVGRGLHQRLFTVRPKNRAEQALEYVGAESSACRLSPPTNQAEPHG